MDPTPGEDRDGSRSIDRRGLRIHPAVFFVSVGAIVLLLAVAIIQGEKFGDFTAHLQSTISEKAGWFYVLAVNLFLAFAVFLLLSPYGRIRLGGKNSKPEFSRASWLAMLFSAGMGIGLVFYSVAEPVSHYLQPPLGDGKTAEAARSAMALTFMHWGFHAWGIYAIVGLSLAYFGFRHQLPLTIRSAFFPIIGDRIRGWIGNLIDILAVVATLFGVATSLGLGVKQIHTGLHFLFGITQSSEPWHFGLTQNQAIQILLIGVITTVATLSVVLGLRRGIRRLSQLNMMIAGLLLGFVFFAGPTWFLLDSFVQNIGEYLQHFFRMSFRTEAYHGVGSETRWQDSWTIFYWAWWIAWSPFVGMFIARISKGRTVREFLTGVLLVPTLMTFVWLTVFGGTALHQNLSGNEAVADAVTADLPTSLFVLLQQFPFATVTCILAVGLVVVFFVTSSDSASLVIDIVTSGGDPDPPKPQRIFWASFEGLVAAILLVAGGLAALQTASIVAGLPFTVVLLVMCYGLLKGLRKDTADRGRRSPTPSD